MSTVHEPIHPGEILLEEFLDPLGISQYRLAQAIGVPPRRINEIVHGKRAISPDTALRLSRALGTSDGFWMNLQTATTLMYSSRRTAMSSTRSIPGRLTLPRRRGVGSSPGRPNTPGLGDPPASGGGFGGRCDRGTTTRRSPSRLHRSILGCFPGATVRSADHASRAVESGSLHWTYPAGRAKLLPCGQTMRCVPSAYFAPRQPLESSTRARVCLVRRAPVRRDMRRGEAADHSEAQRGH